MKSLLAIVFSLQVRCPWPELLKNISETLAGRVGIVSLGTCKANELFHQPLSSFYRLFEEKLDKAFLPSTTSPLTRDQIHLAWLKGGYPEPVLSHDEITYQLWMENYQSTYLYRDVVKLFPKLNKLAYQRFLTILGKLSGAILNKADIARSIEVSEPTVKEYLLIAEGTFLWRHLKSYGNNVVKSIVKMPKAHIQDSGLLHYLLRISSQESLYADPIVGHSFEGFVVEELIKGLQATLVVN